MCCVVEPEKWKHLFAARSWVGNHDRVAIGLDRFARHFINQVQIELVCQCLTRQALCSVDGILEEVCNLSQPPSVSHLGQTDGPCGRDRT